MNTTLHPDLRSARGPSLALLLASGALAALIGACGPTPTPPTEPKPGPAPTSASAAATGTAALPPPAPAKAHGNVPITKSKMLGEVEALGIDLKSAPKLDDLDMKKKQALMPLFVKSLGFKDCTGCHVANDKDFDKDTPHTELAKGMWDHFVLGLRDADGGAVFCDTCHGGEHHLLDRKDMEQLSKFMGTDYEGKLSRADGAEHSCATCHTDVFEGKVFKDVWGIAAH